MLSRTMTRLPLIVIEENTANYLNITKLTIKTFVTMEMQPTINPFKKNS